MRRSVIERRIRHLQREMVRTAADPRQLGSNRAQALIRAMAQERQQLRRAMNHENT